MLQGIPFPDNYFDKGISLLVANHVENLNEFYKEAYRVLKPGGIFLIDDVVPTNGSLEYKKTRELGIKESIRDDYFKDHTLEEHIKAADKAGFKYQITEIKIDEKTRDYFTPECYAKHKGELLGYILKLKK